MKIRAALIAIAIGASAAAAAAQPAKDDPQAKAPDAVTPPVVLASASDVRQPARPSTQPVRRPIPRVTKCRCGDPQLSQGESAGQQPEK